MNLEKEYLPWNPLTEAEREEQLAFQAEFLKTHPNCSFAENAFLSQRANVYGVRSLKPGKNSWIAANATVLDGVRVGAHSVIGAGAVVTKDVPPYTVVGGNPARVLRQRGGVSGAGEELKRFSEQVKESLSAVVEQFRTEEGYCGRFQDSRRADCIPFLTEQKERILRNWNNGFSFELEKSFPPSLMGTEMWLSILYLIADLLGEKSALCYEPKGVHRLFPALLLPKE